MTANVDKGEWNYARYFTHDAGSQWTLARFKDDQSFIANNNRSTAFQWHPKDQTIAWAFGSAEGGETWAWSNNGYTGIMVGRSFTFNVANPDLLFFPSQDYDAAVSTNAGATWRKLSFSGQNWGGYIYGGYVASASFIFAGTRQSWGGPTDLRMTRDGGATYEKSGIVIKGESLKQPRRAGTRLRRDTLRVSGSAAACPAR